MKIREFCRAHKRKVLIVSVCLAAVLAAAGGAAFYAVKNGGLGRLFTGDTASGQREWDMGSFGEAFGQGLTASGLTGIGTTQEALAVENLTDILYVEEVYISSGDEVQEGDTVLKLSEESVELAREALEDALREAELAYRAGTIEYEQSKITAEYERDMAVLKGEQAQAVYEAAAASLASSLEQAEEKLSDAKEQIQEYQEMINSGSFYEYYHVEEYKALYDENLKLLITRMEEWGAGWTQVVSGASSSSGTAGAGSQDSMQSGSAGAGSQDNMQSGSTAENQGSMQSDSTAVVSLSTAALTETGSTGAQIIRASSVSGGDADRTQDGGTADQNTASPTSDQLQILKSLYSVLERNLADYEQALEAAEDASANAALQLQTLQLSLSSLEKSLAEAQSDYDTQLLQEKLTLESTLASAERADSDYEAAMEKAQSDYETLKDAWEDAKENLELFESSLGDGYYRAAGSGTVLRSMIRSGQYLNSDSTVFIYSNPEEMTVTVSVSQEDIAKIDVGNEAAVMNSGSGRYSGTVTQIDPVSTSVSRASVTYQVIVTLEGETNELEANETVTVMIGTGGSSDEEEN